MHVYEARCGVCSGTGWARAPTNGRRGQLSTCMLCHGLGYVRRTTSRFCPDDPDRHMTIARPLTWNGKFAARVGPAAGDTQQAAQQKQQQQQQQRDGGSGGGGGAARAR
ncbi:hypothetical protein HT031_003128 [Scenedesmus sp. PABB004]|nr:hypothetical protein HT031_003128 [Scenedesmus sp. PABB004]